MKPNTPSYRVLPMLKARRRELETCVYCPKLCRSACPVSNAEPRESLTPWGKMSGAHFVANDLVENTPSFSLLPWACTGCEACAGACDHKNPVADTLGDARAALFRAGHAPDAAVKVARTFTAKQRELDVLAKDAERALTISKTTSHSSDSRIAILVGCTYFRKAPNVAKDAVLAAEKLAGVSSIVSACCGASLGMAGDRDGQRAALERFAAQTSHLTTLVVVDAGCAYSLIQKAPSLGVKIAPKIVTLVELAESHVMSLARKGGEPPMFHDPCHLGRGLGLYDAPRAVLTRMYGAPPREFRDSREGATCSGAGGLLPLTMPDVSSEITRTRVADVRGARVVTACASSLRAFRKAGVRADDLATEIARGLGITTRGDAP